MDQWSNLFNKEPHIDCEKCGAKDLSTEWVDNGFGPYSVQASPYHCDACGWVETGCPADECIKERCFSWSTCQGKSIVIED
jgi:hypothetical protein